MTPEPVYLDTAALLALSHRRDALHERSREVLRALVVTGARFVTSQWVLAELLGRAPAGPLRRAVIADTRRVMASPSTTVVPASESAWKQAFDLYQSRLDKDWSLVDCASILICQSMGIRRVFTHDHHFEQAGFTALLR